MEDKLQILEDGYLTYKKYCHYLLEDGGKYPERLLNSIPAFWSTYAKEFEKIISQTKYSVNRVHLNNIILLTCGCHTFFKPELLAMVRSERSAYLKEVSIYRKATLKFLKNIENLEGAEDFFLNRKVSKSFEVIAAYLDETERPAKKTDDWFVLATSKVLIDYLIGEKVLRTKILATEFTIEILNKVGFNIEHNLYTWKRMLERIS